MARRAQLYQPFLKCRLSQTFLLPSPLSQKCNPLPVPERVSELRGTQSSSSPSILFSTLRQNTLRLPFRLPMPAPLALHQSPMLSNSTQLGSISGVGRLWDLWNNLVKSIHMYPPIVPSSLQVTALQSSLRMFRGLRYVLFSMKTIFHPLDSFSAGLSWTI